MWAFIVNPAAGNGRGRLIFESLQKTDYFTELEAVYYYSEYEGHAEEIASRLRVNKKTTAIIVVGGDGTIHEVLNGLGSSGIPIGFIPAGSGNDFARGVGVKGKPETILRKLMESSSTSDYWLGSYRQDGQKARYFVNSMGIGFDAETAHTANKSFYKKVFNHFRLGTGSYVIAILQVLARFKPMSMEINIDGQKRVIENAWLVSIGNHPYYGGGMKIMPNAIIQPDKFSVLLVHSIPKWKVLTLFLTVFTGMHEKIKGVELLEASSLTVTTNKPVYTQVDGQTTTCLTSEITKNQDAIPIITLKD